MNILQKQLVSTFNQLETDITQLCDAVKSIHQYRARVFTLPSVTKGEENNEISTVEVERLQQEDALNEIIRLLNLLFIHNKSENTSNKSAIRLPGAIVLHVSSREHQRLSLLIDEINQTKLTIKHIVTQVDEQQRFEFIRTSLHGLLTLNTYRTLTHLTDVDTIRFGWANKKVINKVTKAHMLDSLQATLESGRIPLSMERSEWVIQLQKEIQLIHSLPHDAILKIQRPVKVQPIARVWDKDQQKQTQFACATPLFVFALEKQLDDITVGDLPDYDASNIALRNRPSAKPVELLIPRLNLYIER